MTGGDQAHWLLLSPEHRQARMLVGLDAMALLARARPAIQTGRGEADLGAGLLGAAIDLGWGVDAADRVARCMPIVSAIINSKEAS